jgi:nitronate monooxygenase
VHDEIRGRNFWPADMDARAIIGESYQDFISGLPINENIAKYKIENESGDPIRNIIWAYVSAHL